MSTLALSLLPIVDGAGATHTLTESKLDLVDEAEFAHPKGAEGLHEFVFRQAVEPNWKADVERLQGTWAGLSVVTHAQVPIHAA